MPQDLELIKLKQMKIKYSRLSLACLLAMFAVSLVAQDKRERDRRAILSMEGCYRVGFNFAETFNYSKDSTYQPSKVKREKAIEWIKAVEDNDKRIMLQHILIGDSPKETLIIKHWRQDWLYENTDFYMYDMDNRWKFVKKSPEEVKGQWTQKVFQVDDSPRYEGSATWVYVDGKTFWENTTDAPLPRRERSKRNDYNVTLRRNKNEVIEDYGWIHHQYNDKIIRKRGERDFVLAEEKGYNTYQKVDDADCRPAMQWWAEKEDLWKKIRDTWDEIFSRNRSIELRHKVDGKRMFQVLFYLDSETSESEVRRIINSYVVGEESEVSDIEKSSK